MKTQKGTFAICTTWGTYPHPRYWKSLLRLHIPGKWEYRDIQGKQGVDEGHNRLIEWFLAESGREWMLHVDADAVLHPGTLERLLSWDKPLVSALAFRRQGLRCPVLYDVEGVSVTDDDILRMDWTAARQWILSHAELLVLDGPAMVEERPGDALFPVARTGAHCLLTHRSVFQAIEPPWFRRGDTVGSASDFYFHREAQRAGFTSYVDRSVIAGHLNGDWCVSAIDFLAWSGFRGDGQTFTVEKDKPGRSRKRRRHASAGPVDVIVEER